MLIGVVLMDMFDGDDASDAPDDDTDQLANQEQASTPINEIFGTPQDDTVFGTSGDDSIAFGSGDDVLGGPTEGDDTIFGDAGRDTIMDEAGANTIFGGADDDFICVIDEAGEDTPDTVFGGAGEDNILGDSGDTLTGGEGTDTFTIAQAEFSTEPVIITDLAEGEEVRITVADALRTESLELSTSEDGEDTLVSFRGEVVVILEGVEHNPDLTVKLLPNVWLD